VGRTDLRDGCAVARTDDGGDREDDGDGDGDRPLWFVVAMAAAAARLIVNTVFSSCTYMCISASTFTWLSKAPSRRC
jgi:hypothetical protein